MRSASSRTWVTMPNDPFAGGERLDRARDHVEGLGVERAEPLVEEDRLQRLGAGRTRARATRSASARASASDAWNVSPPDSVRTGRVSSALAWSTTRKSPWSPRPASTAPPDSRCSSTDAPSTRPRSASSTSHCSKWRASSSRPSTFATCASAAAAVRRGAHLARPRELALDVGEVAIARRWRPMPRPARARRRWCPRGVVRRRAAEPFGEHRAEHALRSALAGTCVGVGLPGPLLLLGYLGGGPRRERRPTVRRRRVRDERRAVRAPPRPARRAGCCTSSSTRRSSALSSSSGAVRGARVGARRALAPLVLPAAPRSRRRSRWPPPRPRRDRGARRASPMSSLCRCWKRLEAGLRRGRGRVRLGDVAAGRFARRVRRGAQRLRARSTAVVDIAAGNALDRLLADRARFADLQLCTQFRVGEVALRDASSASAASQFGAPRSPSAAARGGERPPRRRRARHARRRPRRRRRRDRRARRAAAFSSVEVGSVRGAAPRRVDRRRSPRRARASAAAPRRLDLLATAPWRTTSSGTCTRHEQPVRARRARSPSRDRRRDRRRGPVVGARSRPELRRRARRGRAPAARRRAAAAATVASAASSCS